MGEVKPQYKVELWCRDCTGQDQMGCFDGQSEFLYEKGIHGKVRRFENLEEAKTAGWDAIKDCGPWEFNIVTDKSEAVYSSTFE